MSSTEGDLCLFKSRLSPSPSVAFAAPEDRPPLRSCRVRVTAQSTTLCHARNRHTVYGRAPGSRRCHHGPAVVRAGELAGGSRSVGASSSRGVSRDGCPGQELALPAAQSGNGPGSERGLPCFDRRWGWLERAAHTG